MGIFEKPCAEDLALLSDCCKTDRLETNRAWKAGPENMSISSEKRRNAKQGLIEDLQSSFFAEFTRLFRALQADLQEQQMPQKRGTNLARVYALQYLNRALLQAFLQCKDWSADDLALLSLSTSWFGPDVLDTVVFRIPEIRAQQVRDLFARHTFTLIEHGPFDREPAIDPEMLGCVYEGLVDATNELDERAEAGVFYTSRTEIDLMCRLTLVDYLANHLPHLDKSWLYEFVFAVEASEKGQVDEKLENIIAWSELNRALQEVTILDPACGSGAFLVGMLSVLDDLQARASARCETQEKAYERKKRIIGQSLYGIDIMEGAIRIAKLRLWLALVSTADIPSAEFSTHPDPLLPHLSFHLRSGNGLVLHTAGSGFDIVIGNPPYVRQELLADPRLSRYAVNAEDKRDYKKLLAQTIYPDPIFQAFFRYQPGTGKAGKTLNMKSDLYIYFYLHGLRLLKADGSFCFLTSNSWLDTGYGKDLQEFLLQHCKVKLIIDNAARRSFARAQVNTVITLISAPSTCKASGQPFTTRFVQCKMDFEQMLAARVFQQIEQATQPQITDIYRVHPVTQPELLEEGTKVQPCKQAQALSEQEAAGRTRFAGEIVYTGSKWGSKYLRAPAIYWTLLEKGRGRLVRLGEIADINRGITTGANNFFLLDEEEVAHWRIEGTFLQPAIRSPGECGEILLDPVTLKHRLFICHKTRDELAGTAALEYIKWGETQHFHTRSSVRCRKRWWDLGLVQASTLGFNYLVHTTARTLYAPGGCYFSDNFQVIKPIDISVLALCASLNSTLFQLMVNVFGRTNFGGGLLKLQTYELSDLLCLHPALIAERNEAIFAASGWEILLCSSVHTLLRERQAIDAIIFDALDLTRREREAVYEAVTSLVKERLEKARSLQRR